MAYHSLKKKISPLFCQSCQKELDEIIVCSSGHLTCRGCGERCENCGEVVCGNCTQNKCSHCRKNICSECSNACSKCRKNFCEVHIHKIQGSEKKYCRNCIQRCSECGLIIDPEFTTRVAGRMVCLRCSNRKVNRDVKDLLK